jgi:hypothetical protein
MTTILEAWSREQVRSYVRVLWPKNVPIIEIHRHLIELCCGDVTRVQRVKKNWRFCVISGFRREVDENSAVLFHDEDRTGRRSTSGTDVNTQHSAGIEF